MESLFDRGRSEPDIDHIRWMQERDYRMVWLWAAILGLMLFLCFDGCHHPVYTASWYAYDQHSMTARGAFFNKNALTAASWQYPLGSRVRVTNLDTGRSVVVLINDRGPARRLAQKGRIIDLSQKAFSSIANLNDGIIRIKAVKL